MFAADFEYYRAGSVAEACQLLAAHPGAKLLAGGHSLIPLLKLRLAAPTAVVDIGRIGGLRGISNGSGALRIGALTTHAEIAAAADVKANAAALAEAAGQIGDPAGAQPRHDWRQRRARRPGVGPADRPDRARREVYRQQSGRRTVDRRCGLLPGHDGDGAR